MWQQKHDQPMTMKQDEASEIRLSTSRLGHLMFTSWVRWTSHLISPYGIILRVN